MSPTGGAALAGQGSLSNQESGPKVLGGPTVTPMISSGGSGRMAVSMGERRQELRLEATELDNPAPAAPGSGLSRWWWWGDPG